MLLGQYLADGVALLADDLTNLELLVLWQDRLGAWNVVIVEQVIGVPALVSQEFLGFPNTVAADSFTAEFIKLGGTVVSSHTYSSVPPIADSGEGQAIKPDLRPWLLQARAAGAQAIYAAATSDLFGCLTRQESQGIFPPDSYYLGPELIRVGDHGIANQQCIADAGSMANDHLYATMGNGTAYFNPRAAGAIAAYKRIHPNPADTNAFTFAGYDAASILIDAISRAIDANRGHMPTRQQVVGQLARTANFVGLTGTYGFNANGDPTAPTLQVLQYKDGAWTPIKNISVAT